MDVDDDDEHENAGDNRQAAAAAGGGGGKGKKPKKAKANLPPSAAKAQAQGLPHGPAPGTPLPGHMHPGLSTHEWDVRATSRHITFNETKDPEIVQQVQG